MVTGRRGFSSLAVDGFETDLERGGAYGFDFVELTMRDYDRSTLAGNAERIKELVDANGLDLLVHLPFGEDDEAIGSSDGTARRASVAELRACIVAAGEIGAEKAVLHVETSSEAPHLLDSGGFDQLVETLVEFDEFAREHGVEVCVENMLRRRPKLEDLGALVDRAEVSLTVDTGHARANGHDDGEIAAFVGEYAEAISHFHLNDTRKPEDEHLPFGAGTVDFERIFAALPEEWEGTFTLEIGTRDYDYVEFSRRKLDALL